MGRCRGVADDDRRAGAVDGEVRADAPWSLGSCLMPLQARLPAVVYFMAMNLEVAARRSLPATYSDVPLMAMYRQAGMPSGLVAVAIQR